ncbi:MAG: TonB-dependent receptor [Chitinophagales bacterium]|nr:TonB-dependent receptor [Chitinophagales bacterium]
MSKFLLFVCFVIHSTASYSQRQKDTARALKLSEVNIIGHEQRNQVTRHPAISGTYIFDGKKSEVISLKTLDANITDKTGRQIFAKVPGVFVYDMDGAGNQMNISTRGLDPHRGWEFNIRKDGIITNSDMYTYPASHYSIPMESVERIELVRGTGSLQFGAQFGGMLNYVSKQADTSKKLGFESYNTIGSFNLLSSYNAIHGKLGKWKYYAYFAKKSRDGYRKNEHTDYEAQGVQLCYELNANLTLRADWARSYYLYRIPGPLTDALFQTDPTQSTRSRNYFSPSINIPSLSIKWKLADKTDLEFTSSAVLGARNSVLFDKPATVMDSINFSTNQYNSRQVDIDEFNSYTNELRILQSYKLGKHASHLSFGIHLMNNNMRRRQQGRGTTGSDYDLSLTNTTWGRDVYLKTRNTALFAENSFKLSEKLSINAGGRYESGSSNMSGFIVYYPTDKIPLELNRNFILLGTSISYKENSHVEFYGGWSQTYRPMIFKDIIPTDAFEKVDPNIKDADGYNAEIGTRGSYKFLKWDITAFALQYNHRFGSILQSDSFGNFYTYRTNVGNSLTKGIEFYIQANWTLTKDLNMTIYTSTTYMEGKYTSGIIKSGTTNFNIEGNEIESVPRVISRNGWTIQYKKLSISTLLSYTSRSFADPLNTEVPSANGAVGIVPAYTLLDMNASYKVSNHLTIKSSLNNITNTQYFTKRPLFYPGPGIWPSDGFNGSFSFIVKL